MLGRKLHAYHTAASERVNRDTRRPAIYSVSCMLSRLFDRMHLASGCAAQLKAFFGTIYVPFAVQKPQRPFTSKPPPRTKRDIKIPTPV
eukprot:scaffold399100_cov27-Prasinocladus_malaysianus.AAC.1